MGPTEARVRKLLAKRKKLIAALIDPDEFTLVRAVDTAQAAVKAGASIILVGGSTISDQSRLDATVRLIKHHITSPVILFPGGVTGISRHADAILFSSLLNSTNPYFIVGAQALGSMQIFHSRLEAIPMGYLIFGNSTAVSFIGQVNGIPASKPDLAVIYALAAKYMGMRALYLEAGSGASESIPAKAITAVRKYFDGLLIVGGGITSPERAKEISKAGADILVVGNLLQANDFDKTLRQIARATK